MNNIENGAISQLTLAAELGNRLLSRKRTCSVAESCTGGMIGAAITSIAGSSEWFKGGIIAYDNEVKIRLLGVEADIILSKGAVSEETVMAMASGAARCIGTDCAVAVSGVAGPGGGTNEKPVGLVYIGIFVNSDTAAFRHVFTGDRQQVREATVIAALQHLIEQI